jgi:autotransporter family porin
MMPLVAPFDAPPVATNVSRPGPIAARHFPPARTARAALYAAVSAAALLLCAALARPAAAATAPRVSFNAPLDGQTVSGYVGPDSPACEVAATSNVGVTKVVFSVDGTTLNTESYAPWDCVWDTTTVSNGTHTLTAVAYDAAGNSGSASVQVSVANGSSTSGTRPVGSPPLSDADAAALVHHSSWEPRPQNGAADSYVPSADELAAWRAQDDWAWKAIPTGNFTGTTDEIIQWAAAKWGFDPDVLRAVATQESWWKQSMVGDNGISFGLMEIKSTDYHGTFPLSQESTAFNVDYYAGQLRWCYDGNVSWLNSVSGNGATYGPGDLWGCVGFWYSGRWHDAGAESYIAKIKQYLADHTWTQPDFSSTSPGTPSGTRPVGSPPLTDAVAAAQVQRSGWEPRPQNATANYRVPTADELAAWRAQDDWAWKASTTGNFTGTTDEIIQWAAAKWGFDPDVLRAVATEQSWWDQSTINVGGNDFGLMQIKSTDYHGTYPLSQESTAFNVDYYAGQLRWCYDGNVSWLNSVSGNGATYGPGDLWGCVGFWFSGRWHDAGAESYIAKIKQYLAGRRWTQPGF